MWYKSPACFFEQALPLGNGRLGAMHYAGVFNDKISLNEDTLWSGFPRDKSAESPYNSICKAQELMDKGLIGSAEKEIEENFLGDYTESYQPAGALNIHLDLLGEYSDYMRELDLKTAISSSEFVCNGYKYSRSLFCTAADNVMVYSFKTDNKSGKASVSLTSLHPYKTCFEQGCYFMKSIAPSYAAPAYFDCFNPIRYDDFDNNRALSYVVGIKPVLLNGSIDYKDECLHINSNNFYLIIDIETNFDGFDVQPEKSSINPLNVCKERLNSAEKYSLEELMERHIKDYSSLFDRVELHIEGNDFSDCPTDERIEKYTYDNSDVGLPVLLYDFARYITIASSREGTQATNLQGIWNEKIRAPWSSNYTLNINTQMNYWHIEKSNLSECHMPLMRLIAELSVTGEKAAEKHYGLQGWCSHHNTDIWRHASPVGKNSLKFPVQYGYWNMSGCWLACHIWEHYLYTEDKAFLKEYYPVLAGAAEFLVNWMVEDEDGYLITPLTTSPENNYVLNGEKYSLSRGCAMDQAIAQELFSDCLKASEILGVTDEITNRLGIAIKKLKPLSADSDGYLREWNTDVAEFDEQHRHISSLFGLYPGNTVTDATPELMKAAEKILIRRGYEATGWSLGWRMCCWSRLANGEEAKRFIDNILRPTNITEIGYSGGGGVYPNLLVAHPPYQIDGNFCFAAGINEMLLQYENGKEKPLPALPEQWSKGGYIKGLKLPGNRTTELEWKNGKILKFEISKQTEN